ncbi:HNH endonuclease [Oceanicola sp. D3]|uniref:HNH endonuclease n=1 Tax=Oceanicola sp. D3 TaxID=2587163 RepID=UPI00111DFF51|nr:HNH endonuclease [Oceanicola sp. D3]QDC11251.1 HNH endonuclease [Oceanicola sp. D3]
MKGARITYSEAELIFIELLREMPRKLLHAEFVAWTGRTDVSVSNISALCKRKGWTTGRDGRFAPGQVPPNKGRKGFCPRGSEKGWFKKGERRGVAARLYKPIGTERITREGYLERKVNDDMPLQRRWRTVHLIRWEELNGPLPEGHALKCLDGNKTNTDPSNWKCIPRAMLPRLNGRFGRDYDDAPAELKPLIMATAELEHAARTKSEPKGQEAEARS